MSAWLKYKDKSAVLPIEVLRKTLDELEVPWFLTENQGDWILSVGDTEIEIDWLDNE